MQIKKLIIDEYGALQNREFTLAEGMNIFEGNNESGKSTILSFIRFMLYGMPRKSAGTVTERDRGISWTGGVAGGSMELAVTDKSGEIREYRVERHGQLRGATGHENYAEALKIIDLATGTEVFEGQEPGKVFLGISQETFVSTACIRQLECASVDGVGVNASIENLLFAANEGINTEKAIGKLDDIRKMLLHKNERGGQIFELEAQGLVLTEKLNRAKEAAETIIAKEAAVEATSALETEIGGKLRECEAAVNLYENCTVLRRFDELHTREDELAALEKDLVTLSNEKGYAGPLPDRETIAGTESLLRALSDAVTDATHADAALGKAKNATDGNRSLSDRVDVIESEGGEETVRAKFAGLTAKQKKSSLGSVLSLVFGALLLLVGALSLLCALSFGTPILNIKVFLSLVESVEQSILPAFNYNVGAYNAVCFALLATGAALTTLGVWLSVSAKKAKNARAALLAKVGLTADDTTAETLSTHLSSCLESRALCEAYDRGVEQASLRVDRCRTELRRRMSECRSVLSSFDVTCGEDTPTALSDALRSTINILSALCREKERLESDIKNRRALITSIEEGLGGYNENTLRSVIGGKAPAEVLATTDIEKIEMTHRYYKEQLAAATAKRIAMEKELIALVAASENPAKLSVKLDELNAKLEEKKFQYQSVVMAMEAIDSASDSLRRSVTPRIRDKAGVLMGRITDGKYNELGVSADMTVSIFAGNSTRSIDVLSKGTRDAAYLALRMALAELVCPGNPPPLTLDEGLSLLDEDRAARVLAMLYEYTQSGGQCILFTCHKREGQLMASIGNCQHIVLK